MDIIRKTWIIHPSYHSVNSNMRPYLNPPCHNHCIYILPCEKQSCASLEEVSRELYNHNYCTDIISVLDNCVSSGKLLRELCSHTRYTDIIPVENNHVTLQRNFCVNLLSAITTVISFLWEIVMWFCKEFFLWNPEVQFSHSKLCLNLNIELQQLGWT